MTTEFPHASVLEGVRFTARIGVPNVLQGLFSKRERADQVASVVAPTISDIGWSQVW